VIYSGNIVTSKPSQPPDIGVTLKCLTGYFYGGKMISLGFPGTVDVHTIARAIAQQINLTPLFQTQNKNVSNYGYTGGALKQIEKLNSVAGINAFVDNASLILQTIGLPAPGTRTKIVNLETGMIGIPELTERGIKVKFLLDNITALGGAMQVVSRIYPASNGTYVIYKLGFEICNRDIPFYWVAEGLRIL
jgi:hypothetical protein